MGKSFQKFMTDITMPMQEIQTSQKGNYYTDRQHSQIHYIQSADKKKNCEKIREKNHRNKIKIYHRH